MAPPTRQLGWLSPAVPRAAPLLSRTKRARRCWPHSLRHDRGDARALQAVPEPRDKDEVAQQAEDHGHDDADGGREGVLLR